MLSARRQVNRTATSTTTATMPERKMMMMQHQLSESSRHILKRSQYVCTATDVLRLLFDVIVLLGRRYIARATTNRNIVDGGYSTQRSSLTTSHLKQQIKLCHTSHNHYTLTTTMLYDNCVPVYVVSVILFAVTSRQWYLLHGISLLVLDRLVQIAIKWILFYVQP